MEGAEGKEKKKTKHFEDAVHNHVSFKLGLM